jgi:hypothetical protein
MLRQSFARQQLTAAVMREINQHQIGVLASACSPRRSMRSVWIPPSRRVTALSELGGFLALASLLPAPSWPRCA